MTKAKHTPGPWSVWNFSDSEIDVAIGPDVGGVAVAQVVTTNAHGIATDQTRDTAQANAVLMAAAPELLAALIAITTTRCDGMDITPITDAWDMATAAIAKATGGAV